jgi:probable HAF family extracellular repeat protein
MKRAILMGAAAWLVLAAMPANGQSQQGRGSLDHYVVHILPSPLGGTMAQGTSINDLDQVAGFGTLSGDATMHALLWPGGHRAIDLGTLGGPNSAIAWPNKNAHGVFAGISETNDANPLGEAWSCALAIFPGQPTGKICLGFRWHDGHMEALPPLPGGYNSFATGINGAAETVGWAENGVHEPTCNAPQVLQFEAVVWEPNGSMRTLPPYAGDLDGAATAINDMGQVVGISGICSNAVGGASAQHMLLWQGNTVTNLGSLGGQYWNTPMDINQVGDVTGFSDLPGDAQHLNFNAFLWTKAHGIQNLLTLPGDRISEGLGINDWDQVVGVSIPSGHGFIWQKGVMTDLNTLIPKNSKYLLLAAQDINDEGVITGVAQDKATGATYAFIAEPEDEQAKR